MSKDIKHFPVNWIDGMKINKNHFISLQNNIEDSLRDVRNHAVNHLNYGLLPTAKTQPFEYAISTNAHDELSIVIKNIKIVTPAGGRIEISDYTEAFETLVTFEKFNLEEANHYLILNVDPFQRIPAGIQNMEEIPPRFPHATANYFITTVSEIEVNKNNIGPLQFPLAKITVSEKSFQIVDGYIPPSTTLNGHPDLVSLQESCESFFKQLEFATIQISQKIKFRRQNDDHNLIADIVFDTIEKIVVYLGQTLNSIKWNGCNSHPTVILDHVISIARIMKNSFDSFSGDGKEMLYDYFCEWTDMKKGDYETLFLNTINASYQSFDIAPTVAQVSEFISTIDHLFSILNQLDYIGRKRDSGIFVNENIVKRDKSGKLFFKNTEEKEEAAAPSFLAD